MAKKKFCAVLDIGKTNIKIHVLDVQLNSVAEYSKSNDILDAKPYPQADVMGIWKWMVAVLTEVAAKYSIHALSVTTHGATAALVNPEFDNGLVLPVLDYEYSGVQTINDDYDSVRPNFGESYSPALPAGLNLGRQLYWQSQQFSDAFAKATAILLYPQYWVWRLTGILASECTSLGCHTDLWNPSTRDFTDMVSQQSWQDLFPPMMSAWDVAGCISEAVADDTGLPTTCKVHVGIHDSNASLLRYLRAYEAQDLCLMSTGTWVVGMAKGPDLNTLNPDKDMLANVNAYNEPLPCIRFMGGREFAEICSLTDTSMDQQVSEKHLIDLIQNNIYALPNFSDGSGPFGMRQPEIIGNCENGAALATLYCALMMSHCADLLGVTSDIIIVGSYVQNEWLCQLFAQLRGTQSVLVSRDTGGTVRGAGLLTQWHDEPAVTLSSCQPSEIDGLEAYYDNWLQHCASI